MIFQPHRLILGFAFGLLFEVIRSRLQVVAKHQIITNHQPQFITNAPGKLLRQNLITYCTGPRRGFLGCMEPVGYEKASTSSLRRDYP
jgi:hypothetical protein